MDALFAAGDASEESTAVHRFDYRLTRLTGKGPESVVVSEDRIPPRLLGGFHDEID
ncbi:hypothetical protein BH11PSE6_BH11PSE6_01160 [soil metagenome]